MGELVVKEKSVVVPGEVLTDGMDYLPARGTYRVGKEIRASLLGLLQVEGRALKIIPLSGRYHPKRYDVVIGKVIDVSLSGWRIELNSAYSGMLMLRDATSGFVKRGENLTKIFDLGDYVVTKITNVSSQNLVDLTTKGPGLRRLDEGRIIKVNPKKVPRIIGKKGSMVSMIKNATNTNIVVGQNGVIWIKGEPEQELIVVKTIRKVEAEAHLSGLTDRVKGFLESETGNKINDSISDGSENDDSESDDSYNDDNEDQNENGNDENMDGDRK